MIIKKKIRAKNLKTITGGKKNFDLRLNDFAIKKGDTFVLEEWDPKKGYSGKKIKRKVSYVARFKIDSVPYYTKPAVKKKGLQIIGFK